MYRKEIGFYFFLLQSLEESKQGIFVMGIKTKLELIGANLVPDSLHLFKRTGAHLFLYREDLLGPKLDPFVKIIQMCKLYIYSLFVVLLFGY